VDNGNNSDFLKEGFIAYPNPMFAVREFRRQIQQKARMTLEYNLASLSKAIGRNLLDSTITTYANPDSPEKQSWDGTWAWIAVKLPVPDFGDSYHGIVWQNKGGSVAGSVTSNFEPKPILFEAARDKFCGIGGAKHTEFHQLEIREPLPREDGTSFESTLDKIINEWVGIWNEAGGPDSLVR